MNRIGLSTLGISKDTNDWSIMPEDEFGQLKETFKRWKDELCVRVVEWDLIFLILEKNLPLSDDTRPEWSSLLFLSSFER